MKTLFIAQPSIKDLKYRQEWMKDSKTMSYNAGYDMNLNGYDYDTGTISKTDDEMLEWYNKWIDQDDRFYAYVYAVGEDEPVGEVYFYLDGDVHSCGILIQEKYRGKGYSYRALLELEEEAFIRHDVDVLSDMIPLDREGAIKTFKKAGFVHTNLEKKDLKFGKEEVAKQLLITKEMYVNKYGGDNIG